MEHPLACTASIWFNARNHPSAIRVGWKKYVFTTLSLSLPLGARGALVGRDPAPTLAGCAWRPVISAPPRSAKSHSSSAKRRARQRGWSAQTYDCGFEQLAGEVDNSSSFLSCYSWKTAALDIIYVSHVYHPIGRNRRAVRWQPDDTAPGTKADIPSLLRSQEPWNLQSSLAPAFALRIYASHVYHSSSIRG